MHRLYRITVLLPVLLLADTAGGDSRDTAAVPVHEEYRHRLVFEKDHVRIMSVNIPPGDTSAFHIHEDPTVYVVISAAALRSQQPGKEWQEPEPSQQRTNGELIDAAIYRERRLIHRVQNTDKGPFRVIGIMNGGPGRETLLTTETKMQSREHINNNWFATGRFSLLPGAGTDLLRYDSPAIVIQTSEGHSDVLIEEVSTAEKTVSGNWSWHNEGIPFRLRNLGKREIHLVVVEVR